LEVIPVSKLHGLFDAGAEPFFSIDGGYRLATTVNWDMLEGRVAHQRRSDYRGHHQSIGASYLDVK
jgi:hypothetical protein